MPVLIGQQFRQPREKGVGRGRRAKTAHSFGRRLADIAVHIGQQVSQPRENGVGRGRRAKTAHSSAAA